MLDDPHDEHLWRDIDPNPPRAGDQLPDADTSHAMTGLRAITIRSPWVEAIVTGHKTVENRTRGPGTALQPGDLVAIHKAKSEPRKYRDWAHRWILDRFGAPMLLRATHANLKPGHIVAVVVYCGTVETSDDPWHMDGHLGIVLRDVHRLKTQKQVAARGQLGWWRVGEAALVALAKQDHRVLRRLDIDHPHLARQRKHIAH